MKTIAIITVAVLLALAGLIGYKTFDANRRHEAIANLLKELEDARRVNTIWRKPLLGPPIKTLRVNRFIACLLKIDTKDCPQDVRTAWINYVQSYERTRNLIFARQQNLLEKNTKLTIKGELGAHMGGAYESEHANNLLAVRHLAKIDHKEKLLTLERIAFHYGVNPFGF